MNVNDQVKGIMAVSGGKDRVLEEKVIGREETSN